MRYAFIGILLLFLLLISFGVQSVLGDKIETLGVAFKGQPQTCIFEPHPEYTDKQASVVQAAENAVQLWEDGLYEHIPNGNWDLETTVIPIEEHHTLTPYDFPHCDILLSFENINEGTALGYTHVNFSSSVHKYTHAVTFLNEVQVIPKVHVVLGQQEQMQVGTTINVRELPMPVIQNIVLHEFGHTLGLGHYNVTSHPVSDTPWLTRSAMYYAMDAHNLELMKPLYVDIKMVEKIYSPDGFGGSIVPKIPRAGYYSPGDDEICTWKCKVW